MSVPVTIIERLGWASKHIDDANRVSEIAIRSGLHRLAAKREGKGRLVVRIVKTSPFPREFSLLIGDAAHNIRAALDNLAFAIVKPPKGKEKSVYFPIAKNKKTFLKLAKDQLPGVSIRVRAAFERLQPYHRRKMPQAKCLALIKALNDWDKHRQLSICASATGGITFNPSVTGPHTVTVKRVHLGVVKLNAIVAVIEIGNAPGESYVKMNPKIAYMPVFDKRMPKELVGLRVFEVLRKTLWYIDRTVVPSLRNFI